VSAHPTPGPWRVVVDLVHNEPHRFRIASEEKMNIATVPVLDDQDLANARLISATPDMLQALEAILDVGLSEETFAMGFKAVAKARNQGEG
jgi:hypothetical protein